MQLTWVLIVILGIIGALENKFRNKKSAVYGFGYGILVQLAMVFGIIPVIGQILYYYAFKSLDDSMPITFWIGFLFTVLISVGIVVNVWLVYHAHKVI